MSEFLLNEVCELIVDCPHTTAKDEGEGFPLVRTPNIGKGRLVYDGMHRVCEDVYNKRNARAIPQENDLIFAREATAGNVALIQKGEKVCLGQRTVLIRPNQEMVNPAFLTYFLLAPKQQYNLLSTANGATVAHVNLPTIRNLKIDLPELSTQHRIATILSRYDSLIENYQKQIKLLEEAAQRLYKEWLVDLHFPGYENTLIIDGVPEGWEKKLVGDVTPIKTGKKDANFGTDNGPFPFFTCAQEPIKAPSYSFDTSAVILAGNGDFNVKLYRGKFEAYQRTYVLEPTNENMLYLLYFCISENMNRLATGASGSTIKFLTKGMIESLVIIEPSICVLDSFNQIIEPIRTQKENLQSQIRLLTEARDRLLPKIMSGEIEFNFK